MGIVSDERSASDCNQANSKSNIINKVGHFTERVTGIEPALSAWEAVPSGPVTWPDLRSGVSASDRERPLVTGVNGPLMARRTAVRPALMAVPWSSPVLLDSCHPSGRGRRVKAREATACGSALTRRSWPRQSSSEVDGARLCQIRRPNRTSLGYEQYDEDLRRRPGSPVDRLTSASGRQASALNPSVSPMLRPFRAPIPAADLQGPSRPTGDPEPRQRYPRPLPYQIISAGRRASLMADRRPSWLSVSGRYDPRLTSASGTWRARPSDP